MYTKYQNKYNPNKYIEVKKYACGHYVWKQYICPYDMGIRNYTGCTLKNVHIGVWQRVSKATLKEVLEDYNQIMFKVEKEDLIKFETKLFHDGLCGGGSIVPVELENGINVKKDFHFLYNNKDITIRFYYKRNDNGVWCDLIRIQFENIRLHTVMTFYCE